MIKAVIFDFGGVVHGLSKVRSTKKIADLYGLPEDTVKPFTKEFGLMMGRGEITEEEFWDRLSQKLGKPKPENYREIWHNITTEDFKLFPEIIDFVNVIKSRGILTIVFSNTILPHTEYIRKQGWYDHFDKVFLSYEMGIRKPDIKAYEQLLQETKLKPGDCLMVDDFEENLVPARKLGMKTVLAINPDQVIKDITSFLPAVR